MIRGSTLLLNQTVSKLISYPYLKSERGLRGGCSVGPE